MRRFVLIAALAFASASAQAGGTRSLSSDATPNDPPAATHNQKAGVLSAQARDSRSLSGGAATNDLTATAKPQPKGGALSAQTDSPAPIAPAVAPPPAGAVETPRYAPPRGEAAKPVDTTHNTETPVQPAVQTPVQAPAETQAPRHTAQPAPVDNGPVAATPTSTQQHMPSRESRYRHGRAHHADYYGSDWSDYGWDYGRPHFRTPHWSTRRIIAALHRFGFYW